MKKALKILAVLIILLILGGLIFIHNLKPKYSGKLKLSSLNSEVEVHYDNYGIPHIYAQNELDARRVLGYVHAQDRLWQMELVRRIAAGRLSEMFGEKLIKTDKFFSGLGIDKEDYTLKDMYNVFGYMSFSFAIAHKTDPLLTEIKEKLGIEYLKDRKSVV